ncbi:MAG: hypothetical protein LUG50_04610 [Planctomycetaceae bacterium]|nr:hypothetical protein [Planctomycetaceae bacterium]
MTLSEKVRALCLDGWTPRRIAGATGISVHCVMTEIRRAGLTPHRDVDNPITGYRLPVIDAEEWDNMTDRQQEEYNRSIMRVFTLRTELNMSEERARLALELTLDALMAGENVDREQAVIIQRIAREHLERLEKAKEDEP